MKSLEEILKEKTARNFKILKRDAEGLEPLALEMEPILGKSLAWSVVRNPKYSERIIKAALEAYRKNEKGKNYFFGILNRKMKEFSQSP